MHGFVPHGSADEQVSGAGRARQRAADGTGGGGAAATASFFSGRFGNVFELEPRRRGDAEFKRGDIICREGEYGSTAFYILDGKARVSISSPMAHVKTLGALRKFLGKLSSQLTQRDRDNRDEEN